MRERERERENEIERESACVRALLQYKAVLYKWPYLETRMARVARASSQYDQTLLLFFAYHLRWMYIPRTHTGLQKIQKISSNLMWYKT